MGKISKRKGLFKSPKGMHDILPYDQFWWEKARKGVKDIADSYNFLRIDTTFLEDQALFERSLGATSDVVEKQMFSIKTKGDDVLVLRPEGTASIARAYIEHGLSSISQPVKLYYIGPMFRYEQPQAGRFRQFYQAGFEIVGGDEDAVYDAQIILACYRFLESLKIKGLTVKLNTIGCRNCRPAYRKKLVDYYNGRVDNINREKLLCGDCKRRITVNPLRLLDCKQESCQELKKDAPTFFNGLCAYCKAHFKGVLEYVEELKIPYIVDNYLVRGLDYYNRTVFEIFLENPVVGETKFDFALAGGGRYDYLIEMLGGRDTAGVGGAIGLDRVVEFMKANNLGVNVKFKQKIFLIHMGDLSKKKSLALIESLRSEGIDVAESLGKESLKAQLRLADKTGALLALIFGQKEALEDSIIIRDLQTGAQETVPLHRLASVIKHRLK